LKKGLDVDNAHFDLFYRLPYKSYYEVQKSIEDNPEFDTVKAQKKLRAYVESHQQTIDTKAALMADHFLQQVVATKKLRGQARGMVVTRNIESAIRYYFAIQKELKAANAPFQAIVAFSGKKTVDGIEHTEESLNGFPSKDIPDKLAGDIKPGETNYRLLVVANKFLTGFDEPLLHSMYVDKRLQSVLAVQALSRLNRCNAKMQKQDTFILDFYNTAAEIKEAFDPFYTATSLTEPTDVNVLHDLKDALDDGELYSDEDIEKFNERFFDAWDATPEEQRVKLINIMENVQKSAAYQAQVVDNPDEQNRRIALESLISQAVNKERKKDLDLYKIYAGDPDFKKAFEESIIRILALHEKSKPA